MANKLFKDITIKIDSAAGSLVDITAYVSSESVRAAQDTLEDTALSDEERSYLFGLAGASFSLGGFVNTTTDGIFGPLAGNRTTATKTYQVAKYSGGVYRGETLITSVEYSGSSGALQTFSVEGTFDGVMIRTSVAL